MASMWDSYETPIWDAHMRRPILLVSQPLFEHKTNRLWISGRLQRIYSELNDSKIRWLDQ